MEIRMKKEKQISIDTRFIWVVHKTLIFFLSVCLLLHSLAVYLVNVDHLPVNIVEQIL